MTPKCPICMKRPLSKLPPEMFDNIDEKSMCMTCSLVAQRVRSVIFGVSNKKISVSRLFEFILAHKECGW